MSLQMFKMFKYFPFAVTSIRNANKKNLTSVLPNLQKRKMSFQFFDKLSQNFTELLNDKDNHNVIIEAKDKKTYTAHSSVLKYRSLYFRKELENIIPDENNIKTIIKPNISDEIFDIILKYIYGGIVNLEKVETRFIFDLMLAANKFELEELSKKLETILIEDKASWLKTHFYLVCQSDFDKQNSKDLEFCNDIVAILAKYPSLIFDNLGFTSLPESALVSLLKRDDLRMKEVKIWDYVIKWGIAQNPTLPINLKHWTKKNFRALKTTLQQCLPLIRYFHIANIEIYDKIRPFKKILDKQLWEDINQHLFVPKRPVKSIILPERSITEPFSTIISEDHVAEISSWIDRKTTTYSTTNIPYKFELILRGTRDGFTPQIFSNTCHDHACTVIVTKVKGTDEIIGGYNPLVWDNTYNDDQSNDGFIFSLKNGNLHDSILSRVTNTKYAIRNSCKNYQNHFGPYFGYCFCLDDSKSDFKNLENSCCDDYLNFYEERIRETYGRFSIDNYEVFKVVRKS
ncbi:hypothetical protein Glove_428g44 [Diversispora epigaea]|uniref:BTB domain-containing protein n=1 Tax=Diversispora epigaea TaxID=1348612 RepID=A0A397GXX8_9GLOM|nr:hypothetical protein Glove_428g44 [Diversispora epigaea]